MVTCWLVDPPGLGLVYTHPGAALKILRSGRCTSLSELPDQIFEAQVELSHLREIDPPLYYACVLHEVREVSESDLVLLDCEYRLMGYIYP